MRTGKSCVLLYANELTPGDLVDGDFIISVTLEDELAVVLYLGQSGVIYSIRCPTNLLLVAQVRLPGVGC